MMNASHIYRDEKRSLYMQARSQGRKSDEARPRGRAKLSEKPKFLRIFNMKRKKYEKSDKATASSASCWLRAWYGSTLNQCWPIIRQDCKTNPRFNQHWLNINSGGSRNYQTGGADLKKRSNTHHSWVRQPLEGSGGMLPRKILKISAQIWSFFCICDHERREGQRRLPLDPPLIIKINWCVCWVICLLYQESVCHSFYGCIHPDKHKTLTQYRFNVSPS